MFSIFSCLGVNLCILTTIIFILWEIANNTVSSQTRKCICPIKISD